MPSSLVHPTPLNHRALKLSHDADEKASPGPVYVGHMGRGVLHPEGICQAVLPLYSPALCVALGGPDLLPLPASHAQHLLPTHNSFREG